MFSIEEFIIAVFCCVDDWLTSITKDYPIQRRGFAPQLYESEVMTMEIVGEFLGMDADKAIWQYFCRHWASWFPTLTSRSSFARQAANLWQYKQLLQQRLAQQLGAYSDSVHLIDGIPIPLCCFTRAYRCASFKGEADYGFSQLKMRSTMAFMDIYSSVLAELLRDLASPLPRATSAKHSGILSHRLKGCSLGIRDISVVTCPKS